MKLFINKILEIPITKYNNDYILESLSELKQCSIYHKIENKKLIILEQKCTLEEIYINNFLVFLSYLEVEYKIELDKDFSWGIDMRLDLD